MAAVARIALALIATLAMAFLQSSRGCGYTPDPLKGEGEPCTRSSECQSHLACSGGVCRATRPDAGALDDAGVLDDAGAVLDAAVDDAGVLDDGGAVDDGGVPGDGSVRDGGATDAASDGSAPADAG